MAADIIPITRARDPRIQAMLEDRLPGQTQLHTYLDQAIRYHNGGLVTATKIADLLALEVPKGPKLVTDADIQRLGVHEDTEAFERLIGPLTLKREVAVQMGQVLEIRLIHDLERLPREARTVETVSALPPPTGSRNDPKDVAFYKRIYLCALAMLAGVEADPRDVDPKTRVAR